MTIGTKKVNKIGFESLTLLFGLRGASRQTLFLQVSTGQSVVMSLWQPDRDGEKNMQIIALSESNVICPQFALLYSITLGPIAYPFVLHSTETLCSLP